MTPEAAPEPPRVVRVIARLNVGGPARHVAVLDDGLRGRGYDTLLLHGKVDDGEGSFAHLVTERRLPARFVAALGRRVSPWSDLRAFRAVVRAIFEKRPDVVHTHTAKAGVVGRLAAIAYNATRGRQRRCLIVHTYHGTVFRGYFGGPASLAVRVVERLVGLGTDRVVVVSERQRREVVDDARVAAVGKVRVVPLGLDLEPFLTARGPSPALRRELAISHASPVVGFVGRLAAIKDPATALRAFHVLRRAAPRAVLLVAGDGPLRGEMTALAGALGIAGAVRFLGWRHDLPSLYRAMDVLLLSSRNEGTPVAVIEAMASGRPVVATDVGGVPDVVASGRTGLLAPAGQPAALAARIEALARDPATRARMGEDARKASARYASSRLVADVDRLYRDGLAVRRRANRRRAARTPPDSRATDPGGGSDPGRSMRAPTARRLLIVLPHLGPGGAQRVASCLAGHWAGLGRDVTVVTRLRQPPDAHALDPRARRIRFPEKRDPVARLYGRLAGRFEPPPEPSAGSAAGPGRVREGQEIAEGMFVAAKQIYLLFRAVVNDRTVGALVAAAAKRRLLGRGGFGYVLLLRAIDARVRYLRRLFVRTRPDVVVSFLGATNVMTVAASAGLGHRTVISERNDPAKQQLRPPWEELRPILYPCADVVTANSHGALESMGAYCAREKLAYAPNPLRVGSPAGDGPRADSVLFLARLVRQKAPDVLIDAFARFARAAPGWRLDLAGGGPLLEELRARVRALDVEEAVTFHGVVRDPAPLLAASRIFVLPSRFEGTPNALLEAMASRLPCIVSDASPGPLQLVEDGVTGLVVKTGRADALAAALERLARDAALRRALGDAAFERVGEFAVDRVAAVWDTFLFSPDAPAGGGGGTVTVRMDHAGRKNKDGFARAPFAYAREVLRSGVSYTANIAWLLKRGVAGRTLKLAAAFALGQLSVGAQAAALGVLYWYGEQTQADAVVALTPLGVELRAREDLSLLWAVVAGSAVCFLASAGLLYLSRSAVVELGQANLACNLTEIIRMGRRLPDPRAPDASRIFLAGGIKKVTAACQTGAIAMVVLLNVVTPIVGGVAAGTVLLIIDPLLTALLAVTALLWCGFLYPLMLRQVQLANSRGKESLAFRNESRALLESSVPVPETLASAAAVAETHLGRFRAVNAMTAVLDAGVAIIGTVAALYLAYRIIGGGSDWPIFVVYLGGLRVALQGGFAVPKGAGVVSRYYPELVVLVQFLRSADGIGDEPLEPSVREAYAARLQAQPSGSPKSDGVEYEEEL